VPLFGQAAAAKRREDERKAAELQRLRLREAAEKTRLEEARRIQEAARAAEAKRKEEAARAAEAKRKEQEACAAEAEKKKQEEERARLEQERLKKEEEERLRRAEERRVKLEQERVKNEEEERSRKEEEERIRKEEERLQKEEEERLRKEGEERIRLEQERMKKKEEERLRKEEEEQVRLEQERLEKEREERLRQEEEERARLEHERLQREEEEALRREDADEGHASAALALPLTNLPENIIKMLECLQSAVERMRVYASVHGSDITVPAKRRARAAMLALSCAEIEDACFAAIPTAEPYWTRTHHESRVADVSRWVRWLSEKATVDHAHNGVFWIEDRLATLWSRAEEIVADLCRIYDRMGALTAVGLSHGDCLSLMHNTRVGWGVFSICRLLFKDQRAIVNEIVSELLEATTHITAALDKLGIKGVALSISFANRILGEMVREGHAAVQKQFLAAKMCEAAGVHVSKESFVQLYNDKTTLNAGCAWVCESELQKAVAAQIMAGGLFKTTVLCNFTAVAATAGHSRIQFFHPSNGGLLGWTPPKLVVFSFHEVKALMTPPPSSHALVLDELRPWSLVATTSTLPIIQQELRQQTARPSFATLQQEARGAVDKLPSTSTVQFVHERSFLPMPGPVVSITEAITQADAATKQAVRAITDTMPPSSTTSYIQRACANVQPSASCTPHVVVPAAPVDEGEVGITAMQKRDSEIALLRILVNNAPDRIFEHPAVVAMCTTETGEAPCRKLASKHRQGVRVHVGFRVTGSMVIHMYGASSRTHEDARASFWDKCVDAHAELKEELTCLTTIAQHPAFEDTMDKILETAGIVDRSSAAAPWTP